MERLQGVCGHLTPQHSSATQINFYKEGNWEPIKEENEFENLEVIFGEIPHDLDGYYGRTGPNAFFDFSDKPYHFFDGDGMIHAIRLQKGQASYANRWVRTKRLESDRRQGFSVSDNAIMNQGDVKMLRTTLDEKAERMGKANTSLICHAKKVMSLDEQDKPYLIEMKQLNTIGRHDFNGKWHHSVTAHPKIDPETKEMFFFSYNLARKPWFNYGVADKNGEIIRSFPVKLRFPTMIHDMAITKNFAIILDCPLEFRFQPGKNPWNFNTSIPTRFGVLPRYATSDEGVKWFEFSPCYIYHTFNAWEQDNTIHLVASRNPDIQFGPRGSETHESDKASFVYEYVMDLSTGRCSERKVHGVVGEFPVIDNSFLSRKNRFFYHVSQEIRYDRQSLDFRKVIKYDREKDHLFIHQLPDNTASGEFVFVPRKGRNPEDEDDGYLVSFCHNNKTQVSEFYIINAKTFSDIPVARVKIPKRVPWGFHGTWIDIADL